MPSIRESTVWPASTLLACWNEESIRVRSAPKSAPTASDSLTGHHKDEHCSREPAPHALAVAQPTISARKAQPTNRRGRARRRCRSDQTARPLTRQRSGFHIGWSRKLAAAGLAALLLLPLGVIIANAQDAPPQSRYVAQPGDTLDNLAWEFAVEPAAILAASSGESRP